MQVMRILSTAVALAALCVLTLPAQAEVYKWTDADGVVRYGQLPPPGVQAQAIRGANAEASPSEAPATAEPKTPVQDEAQLERIRTEQAARETKRKAEAETYCNDARARLQTLNDTPSHRLATLGEDGERSRMTQKDHDAQRAQLEVTIKEHCS